MAKGNVRAVSPDLQTIIGHPGTKFEEFVRSVAKQFAPTVMVVAATGNVTKPVVQALVQDYPNQFNVHGTARDLSKIPADDSVTYHQFDFDRPEQLKTLLKGVDYVFFTAPIGPNENRCELVRPVIDASKECGVRHVVLSSVLGAEYEQIAFAKQFRGLEKYLESSGLDWTILRPTGFMENIWGQAEQIRKQNIYPVPMKNAAFSPIATRDIGRIAAKILTNPSAHKGKHYAITGPESLTGEKHAEILSKVLGKEVKYVDLDPEILRGALQGMGMAQWLVKAVIELQVEVISKNMANFISPETKNILGTDGTTFEEFVKGIAPSLK